MVIVGRETWATRTHGLPATRESVTVVVSSSVPPTGCASGGFPGHIGTCVCPGDGCQVVCCALAPPNANTTQMPKIKGFITVLTAYMKHFTWRIKSENLSQLNSSD